MTATRKSVTGAILVAAACLGLWGALAQAQVAQPIATVELSGVIVLRVRDAGPWATVYARGDEIYKRLNEAINELGDELSPDRVQVQTVGGLPAVTVGGHLIVTVTPVDARLNGTTPDRLARIWASNLKKAFQRFLEIHRPARPPVF